MSRRFTLRVHQVAPKNLPASPVHLDTTAIQALFGQVDVAIDFDETPGPIQRDPGTDSVELNSLRHRLALDREQDGRPVAHLILGRTQWPIEHHGIRETGLKGVLDDLINRSQSAVFIGSFTERDPADLSAEVSQSAAHEIGHMLNLDHVGGALAASGCTMQTGNRPSVVPRRLAAAWDAGGIRSKKPPDLMPNYPLSNPTAAKRIFPLSRQCRDWLQVSSTGEADVLPYRGSWRFPDTLAGDRPKEVLEASLAPLVDSFAVGDPLLLRLKLKNTASRPLDVPAYLEPSLGNLQIVIESEDGRRVVTPSCRACGVTSDQLAPGESRAFDLVRFVDRYGLVLRSPGKVRIRMIGVGTRFDADVELDVQPCKPTAALTLLKHLKHPRVRTASLYAMARRILRDEDCSASLRGIAAIEGCRAARSPRASRGFADAISNERCPGILQVAAALESVPPFVGGGRARRDDLARLQDRFHDLERYGSVPRCLQRWIVAMEQEL
jgi:hypothetical protein